MSIGAMIQPRTKTGKLDSQLPTNMPLNRIMVGPPLSHKRARHGSHTLVESAGSEDIRLVRRSVSVARVL